MCSIVNCSFVAGFSTTFRSYVPDETDTISHGTMAGLFYHLTTASQLDNTDQNRPFVTSHLLSLKTIGIISSFTIRWITPFVDLKQFRAFWYQCHWQLYLKILSANLYFCSSTTWYMTGEIWCHVVEFGTWISLSFSDIFIHLFMCFFRLSLQGWVTCYVALRCLDPDLLDTGEYMWAVIVLKIDKAHFWVRVKNFKQYLQPNLTLRAESRS